MKLFEIIDDPTHDKLYLITEYVKHGPLSTMIQRLSQPLSTDTLRSYFRQLITALEYCHENAQIIHRDIKPENILLDENDTVKLADFGVSAMMENGSDKVNTTAGSHFFLSPEATLGNMYKGKKNDIWACGVTLYYMATKKLPFSATNTNLQELYRKI